MDIQQAMYPNFTLFIQMVLFLVFVALIRFLLVRPYSQVIEERERRIQSNLEEATRLKEEAKRYLEEAKAILEKGRVESNQLLDSARREAERFRAELIAKVEQEVQREIGRAVEEIKKSLEEEKRKLEERIGEVVDLISKKVLEEAA